MRIDRLTAGILVAAVLAGLLAGCDQPPAGDESDIAYRTAGIAGQSTLLTVNGTDVKAEEYLFFLGRSIETARDNGYLEDDAAWAGEIDGQEAVSYLKQDALNTVKLQVILRSKAEELGVSISEEDRSELESNLAKTTDVLSTQGMTLQDALDTMCVTEETFRQINETYYLGDALIQAMSQPGGELEATDARVRAFAEETGIYSYKQILLSTVHEDGSAFSDAEKANVKAEADALVAQLRASDDPATLFNQLMEEKSQDTELEENPDGYTAMPGQEPAAIEEAVLALSVGQISSPVETEQGYYILLRQDAATRAQTISAYPAYRMNQLLTQWVEQAQVTTTQAYDSLDVKGFYDALQTVAQEKQTQAAQSQSSPAPSQSTQ